MKLFFFSFLFISFQSFSQTTDSNYLSQKEVKKAVDQISKFIRKQSIVTDSLKWREIDREVEQISTTVKSKDDLEKINNYFTKQLRKAGDKHSFFLTGKRVDKIKSESQEGKQAESRYLENGVGYIKVPALLTFDGEKDKHFANNIRRQIQTLDTEHMITGWVVDLRHNTGGNMWPMLAGLNALIEDGIVGYFVYPASKKNIAWKSTNGNITFTGLKVDTYKIKNQQVKIAVLIDSLTASSGEMTAISFSGLPNVRFFGTPSGGYTTANITIPLLYGNILNLAASYVADRNHKEFMDKIIPDEIVTSTDKSKDETLGMAAKWLGRE
ncbi:MAG: S41 family peptidase, partial [Ginsengibacter sp.]